MSTKNTYFLFDERTFWHTTRDAVLVMPTMGNLQPLSGLGHVESAENKRRFLSMVHVSGLMDELKTKKSQPITDEQANLVHPASYLESLKAQSEGLGGDAGMVAPFGHKGYEYACVSAGLVAEALQLALREKSHAYALSRPPGHHCLAEAGMGFCLLANIPIAIAIAKQEAPDLRVAVIDWDVHHGNGTQSIFYERDDVFTISLHQEDCFPRQSGFTTDFGEDKGEGYNMNIPLPPGTGHGGYLYAMEQLVIPAVEHFNPDVIIVASGYDAGMTDPLSRMMLTSESFVTMTQMVKELSTAVDAPIVMAHEGGYCVAYTPILAYKTLETLAGSSLNITDDFMVIFEG